MLYYLANLLVELFFLGISVHWISTVIVLLNGCTQMFKYIEGFGGRGLEGGKGERKIITV